MILNDFKDHNLKRLVETIIEKQSPYYLLKLFQSHNQNSMVLT